MRPGTLALLSITLAACSVPDKHPAATDAGSDGGVPAGPIDTTITESPPEFSNASVATFRFTSNHPAAEFECSVDGEKPTACTSPFSRTLDDGSHTFSVRATDGEGDADDTPAEHLWTIDTVAPATTLTEMPPAADNSTMVTFSFTSNEMNVVFECSLDNAPFTPCRSGDAVGPIGDGAHAFAVRARDRAGNVDASPAIHAWQVDTSTPDTQLLSGPVGASPSPTATFTFLSPDAGPGATFECSLDGSPFAACTSPREYANLAMGVHTFRVRVRDAVGNLDPTPAMRTWTVDLTPPETTIESGPSGVVPAASASFAFTSNEAPVTFECSLDGAPFAACTSPFNATMLAQGPHSFAVRATDAAGHVDASPATASWTVDTVPPEIMVIAGPSDGATVGPRVVFMFTSSEGTFECSLDGAAFTACASPQGKNLAAGSHSFSVRAVDAAGNVSTVTRGFTVACAPPDTTNAAGLLHLDDGSQVQANATGGANATLGSTDQPEPSDPVAITARFGGGLGFAPSEGDLVAWPLALGAMPELTFELWSRPDAIPGTRDVMVSGDLRVALRTTQVSANTVRYSATFIDQNGVMHTATSEPVSAGGWHWVLVSLREPTLRLWVDGALTTTGDVRLGTAPDLGALRLGGGGYGGALDEVWISPNAIVDSEAALARYCPL